jgi:hypothetical protein
VNVRDTVTALVEQSINDISISDGYSTDIDEVTTWKVAPMDDTLITANIKDLADEVESDEEGVWHTHRLHYEVDLQHPETPLLAARDAIRDFIQDVYTSLKNNIAFDNRRYKVRPEGDEFSIEQDEKKLASASIRFYIEFTTKAWDSAISN